MDWPHSERPSPVSLARASGSGGPSNFFQGCVFSGLVHVVSQLERGLPFSFLGSCNFLLPLMSLCVTAGFLVLQQVLGFILCPVAPRHPKYAGSLFAL